MLTLLTTTGNRPDAWAICQKLMARQTYKGSVRWIVVDDGEEQQEINFKPQHGEWTIEVHRPEPFWSPGQNTQARNLLVGLAVVGAEEKLVIIEDDDFYAPDWLETVEQKLNDAELVGESCARYYNVKTCTALEMVNRAHSSLCSTAMRGAAIDTFRRICKPNIQFIDCTLWAEHGNKHIFSGHRVVGIKGLPGRQGIGIGHTNEFSGTLDKSKKILRSWIGADVEAYFPSEKPQ